MVIMTVMAHPDDAELWAGGILAAHICQGGQAAIAVPGHSRVRDDEAAAGAAIIGAALLHLDDKSAEAIAMLLRRVCPDVVITHPIDDIHPDHRAIAAVLAAALPDVVIDTGHPKRVYTSDSYHGLDRHGVPLHLPTIIDVSAAFDTKLTALRAHRSQPIDDHFGPMADTLSRLHGQRIGAHRAEAFRPVPVLGRIPATPHL